MSDFVDENPSLLPFHLEKIEQWRDSWNFWVSKRGQCSDEAGDALRMFRYHFNRAYPNNWQTLPDSRQPHPLYD